MGLIQTFTHFLRHNQMLYIVMMGCCFPFCLIRKGGHSLKTCQATWIMLKMMYDAQV